MNDNNLNDLNSAITNGIDTTKLNNGNNKNSFKILVVIITAIIIVLLIIGVIYYIYKSNEKSILENKIIKNKIEDNIINQNVDDDNIVTNKNQSFDRSYGKIEIVWIDKDNNIIHKPLEPQVDNLTPVKEDNYSFVQTSKDDDDWYNYDNRKWANALNSDGSYFVWIPRYAYKIVYYSDLNYTDKIGYSDSRGILKITGPNELTLIEENAPGLEEAGNHYIVHPAFSLDISSGYNNGGWDKEISGIWVAKYEMSMETDGKGKIVTDASIGDIETNDRITAVSKPARNSWRFVSIKNTYKNSLNYDKNKNSHLMKNSEWGAVAYLTDSQYGINHKKIDDNKNENYYTGGSSVESAVYQTYNGESSTLNSTGIYDLVGGAKELVAFFINNNNEYLQYAGTGESELGETKITTKYKTLYEFDKQSDGDYSIQAEELTTRNYYFSRNRRGDGIFETSNGGWGKTSWLSEQSVFSSQNFPYMARGGNYGAEGTGVFSFFWTNGIPDISDGFRTVLVNE